MCFQGESKEENDYGYNMVLEQTYLKYDETKY